jgi:hypothetical protein
MNCMELEGETEETLEKHQSCCHPGRHLDQAHREYDESHFLFTYTACTMVISVDGTKQVSIAVRLWASIEGCLNVSYPA